MHPADIQSLLKKAGITQRQIAEELGVTTFHVSEVVNKHRVSTRIMAHIATRIGKPLDRVFPEYFRPKGSRVTVRSSRSAVKKRKPLIDVVTAHSLTA